MRKIKLVIVSLIVLCYYFECPAQSFYVSAPKNPINITTGTDIYKVTKTAGGFTSELLTTCSGSVFFSIAMNKNGLYWLDGAFLFKGDISGNSLVNCHVLGPIARGSNAVTVGSDGKIYYPSGSLYSTDPVTLKTINLGAMSYTPSGDVLFYKDNLYMASGEGIIKIDTTNTAKSAVYIPLGAPVDIFGLVSVSNSLHKNTVYALSYVSNTATDIIELDLDNGTVIGIVGSLPYSVLDAASLVEDGSIVGIEIEKINTRQDCNFPTNGIVQVITKPNADQFTYRLSNGMSNATGIFTNVPPGTYQVTVTSPVDLQTSSVTVPAFTLTKPLYNYIINNQVCDMPGGVTFSTSANTSYKIRLGADVFPLNHSFTGLISTSSYHFDILNEYGCSVDAIDITIPRDKCVIQFDPPEVLRECNVLNKAILKIRTKIHSDLYTYTLNGVSNTTGVFNMLPPGITTVHVTSADDTKAITVNIPDYTLTKPVITYVQTNPVCAAPGEIKFSTTDPGLYQIRLGTDVFPFDHKFTGLIAGTYSFTILDKQNCLIDQLSLTLVQEKCLIKFDKTDVQQQCDAINKGVITVLTKAHSDLYTYTLNGISNTTGIFNNLSAGPYIVKITSPEDMLDVPVTVPDYKLTQPVISYVVTNAVCAVKGDIKFSIQDNSSLYKIQYGPDTFPFNHVFTNLSAGKYHFKVFRQNGCIIDEYDAEVKYEPCPIIIDKVEVTAECNVLGKGVIQVTANPIPETYSYTLSTGITNSTGIFNMIGPGTYQLTVSASGGNTPQNRTIIIPDFSLTKPATVINKINPVCELPGRISLAIGTDPSQYKIRFNSSVYPSDYTFTELSAGDYPFEILKKDGCIADALNVTLVMEKCSPVSFPNTFTPNHDGINDVFRANPESSATNFRFLIYDRWGTLLYTSTDLHEGWDGEYNGKPAPVATYFWIATFTTQENKPGLQKGNVTLLR